DGELAMAGTNDGLLLVWRLAQQAISDRITARTADLAMTADGKLAVMVAPRQPMTVWNPREARCLMGGETFGDKSMSTIVTLTDDGRHALTGGLDGQLRLWDLKKGRCLRELGGPGPRLTAIALVAGGLFALASSVDGQVRIYSVHGGGSLAQLEGHAGAVRALAATPDGRFVVTAGEDRSLRLWEIDWELDPEGAFVALGQAPQGKFMQRLTAIFRKRT
ncbi:MAG: hypothetical protein KC910_06955, partial [Candidatus Eremiobacteraeota bacterium]|nr:hypothetical protein [Candidatus Eremiobacteraeota bacterium]